jgi:hypothetical protein
MTAKPRNSNLKNQIQALKISLQAEKDKGANFHFSSAEIELIKWMCSDKEEQLKYFDEGSLDEIHSISKQYKEELREVVRNIYNKITFK